MVDLAVVRPCKGSTGTEVVPEGRLDLDIAANARRLEAAGIEVTDARVLLVIKGEPTVTLYPSGRMLVHTDDLEQARERALWLLALLDLGQ